MLTCCLLPSYFVFEVEEWRIDNSSLQMDLELIVTSMRYEHNDEVLWTGHLCLPKPYIEASPPVGWCLEVGPVRNN